MREASAWPSAIWTDPLKVLISKRPHNEVEEVSQVDASLAVAVPRLANEIRRMR